MNGEYTSWIRFANSLRMRLAMRIATVDREKARSEFLKAFNNEYGTLEAENEPVAVSTKKGYTNPLGELNLVWNETYMSAPMESIMNGYEDPRRTVFLPHARMSRLKVSTVESGRGLASLTAIIWVCRN